MGVQRLSSRHSIPYENIFERKLSAEQLKNIETRVQDELSRISSDVKTAENVLGESLDGKEPLEIIDSHGQDLRGLSRQKRFLEQFRSRVESQRQRVSIDERLQELLGKKLARTLEVVVLLLIAVVLAILIYESYHSYDLPSNTLFFLYVIDVAACAVFMFEFFLRMALADNKILFFKKNWIDFVSSIPIPPMFPVVTADANTWLRIVRAARVLRLVRGFRIAALLWRGVERIEHRTNARVLKWTILFVIGVIFIGGLALHFIEGQTQVYNQYVSHFGQSVWWSFNAVAIGGYADLYEPSFILTQVITAILLIVGLVAFGIFVATLTAIVIPKDTNTELIERVVKIEQLLKSSLAINASPSSKDDEH